MRFREGWYMSREEVSRREKSIEETREYHQQYLRAISNPVRRQILRAIRDGYRTITALQSHTGLAVDSLEWHLSILEHDFCIVKESRKGQIIYTLTQEGKVIDYLD